MKDEIEKIEKILERNEMYERYGIDNDIDELDTLNIICPYCSTKYTAKMLAYLDYSVGCDSCEYGSGWYEEIEIRCGNCKKIVYKKEVKPEL